MDKKRPDKQYLHNWVKNPNPPLLDNRITKNPNIIVFMNYVIKTNFVVNVPKKLTNNTVRLGTR